MPTSLAVHEIGHAVVATRLGKRVDRVWIDDTGGNTQAYWPDREWTTARLRAEVSITYAGVTAEMTFHMKEGRMEEAERVEADPLNASDVLKSRMAGAAVAQSSGRTREQEFGEAVDLAISVLASNWANVVSLSQLLDRDGEISGDVVRRQLGDEPVSGS